MKKKASGKKKTAAKKGLVKKLTAKLAARKKSAPKKLAVKKIPASLAVSQTAAPQTTVKHGPLHLPSKPEPAYAIMHKRDWAAKPPPHEFRIPKR